MGRLAGRTGQISGIEPDEWYAATVRAARIAQAFQGAISVKELLASTTAMAACIEVLNERNKAQETADWQEEALARMQRLGH